MTYDCDENLLKTSPSKGAHQKGARNASHSPNTTTSTTTEVVANRSSLNDQSLSLAQTPPPSKLNSRAIVNKLNSSKNAKIAEAKSKKSHHQKTSSSSSSSSVSFSLTPPKRRGGGGGTSTRNSNDDNLLERTPKLQIYLTYLCYYILEIFGHFRELIRRLGIEKRKGAVDNNTKEFPPLYNSYESFHTRNVYIRNRDCFNRPVCSVPGAEIELLERTSDDYNWTYKLTGRRMRVLNLGSYNYLGFAENSSESAKAAIEAVQNSGVSTCSPSSELGMLRVHRNLEQLIAKFLRVDDSIVFGMGFATNALNIPALLLTNAESMSTGEMPAPKQSLIISDELNHTSIILGARMSGATVKTFKHNDVASLEQVLKKSIVEGHPATRRPWKKILIIVEGIYSMEGTITPLPEIIALKKKYKAYLYLDEAHSVGAVGSSGRGIVEHFGCDPRDVDILMGTFSKSFGAAGGYLAGSRELIAFVRAHSHAAQYATSMSAPVCAQIHRTLETIMGLDGTNEGQRRIQQLAENTKYFRDKLKKMGFIVYGNPDSPVVPVPIYLPSKVVSFNRLMLENGIAVVTVGYPATPLTGARVRFCLSASHTREMLDKVLEAMDRTGDYVSIKFSKRNPHLSFKQLKELDQVLIK